MTLPLRTVRSFVKRQGRTSPRQQRGFTEGAAYLLTFSPQKQLDFSAIFGNTHPVIIEIGFGMGHSLVTQARAHPEWNYLGIEVHTPGIGCLLASCVEHTLSNVRVMQHDATEILAQAIPAHSLFGIQIFFPDPWHKKRHHKRRLIQTEFVKTLCKVLKPGGFLHLATDWEDYARQMLEVLSAEPNLQNSAGIENYWQNDGRRPLTKFEQRGQRLGHGVWDLMFTIKLN